MSVNKMNHGYCIVTGGHINEPAPDQSGTFKVIDPLRHGRNVRPEELPFITARGTADMATLEQTRMPPEPGTVVECEWETGLPTSRRVIGIPNHKNLSQTIPGNRDLAKDNDEHSKKETKKRTSKGFKQSSRDGAEVRVNNDGETWRYDLTRGLTVDAAHYPLAGTILPALKNVETAAQQAAATISPSMISQLPGQIMSIASMFQSMSNEQKSRAKQRMSPDVADGFESMINLIQTADGSGSFVSGNRCNTEVYMENCIDLLSQCTNLSDLYDCMHRIQHDKNLRGLETLPKVKIKCDSAFGTFSFDMDAEGTLVFDDVDANTTNVSVSTLSIIYANTPNVNVATTQTRSGAKESSGNKDVLQKIQQFTNLLSSASTNFGDTTQSNLWKDQAGKVSELMGRLPAGKASSMVALASKAAALASKFPDKKSPQAIAGLIPKHLLG